MSKHMPTFKDDYEFGTHHEEKNIGLISKVFNKNLVRRGGMATMDYDDGGCFYLELKSRRIKHNQYPTTLIGANKVKFAEQDPSRECWFCWNYTDGIWGLKYKKELFDTFEHGEFSRGDRPDHHNRPQEVYWIPHKHLQRLG